MESAEIKTRLREFVHQQIRVKLREVLENKPLYKNNKIEIPSFDEVLELLEIGKDDLEPNRSELLDYYDTLPLFYWNVEDIRLRNFERYTIQDNSANRPSFFINVVFPQTLSLFCSECDSNEPFNFIDAFCLTQSNINNLYDPNIQVFSASYQCQLCKNKPEIFLIRRKNLKISIDGRTPIQQVEVSKFLPKDQREFIRKSGIAFNSGEILAALFFQRTFLEQYVRKATNDFETRELEKVFDNYKERLPEKFNSLCPSLGAIYSRISEDLHDANPSEENYYTSKSEIETHFEALHLYEKQGLIT